MCLFRERVVVQSDQGPGMALLRDKQFWLAISLAVLFWIVMLLIDAPEKLKLDWPFAQPLSFLLLVLVYPVLEELVFRGLIQGWFCQTQLGKRRAGFVSVANLLASTLFVLFHLIAHSWLWAISVFVPSIIFGYFRDKYHSVKPAILLHVIYNSGYFYLYPPM